ncbi:hypothetical protein HETIRDRAFT_429177 [Heterobasidion irregulare TC 32-1]|uniref:Uncharacterized protein n=1 Tax=Heterobasidion irregulare (strain TC 32-1) TaxID=747525 RepID=W4JWW7_HETIT|nr:uncharacterized protein HETIRDRAFT_429177 [Heterobasidion irregulare TC 32-1]ETW78053.1 hypothetical protein HETIRDRAFT_429177 [Heterobasidion irregulare TC 32-1]
MAKVGYDEDFSNLTRHHKHHTQDRVVFITGASRGIGEEIAVRYARAGASLAFVGRKQAALNLMKITILREVPQAKVLTFPMDVTNTQAIAQVVELTTRAT